MKIVFTADVQLHNHKQNATTTEKGLNSRFEVGLETLCQAGELARDGILVIDGDLFDHRKHLEIDVIYHTYEAIRKIQYNTLQVVIITGNHDQFLKNGEWHSTSIFQDLPNVTVVSSSKSLPVKNGPTLHCLAYTEDNERAKAFCAAHNGGVLILHQSVIGASMGHSICEEGLTLEDLCATNYEMVLLGHFHAPQQLAQNVHYIGSPYQVNRSEAGDKKRFIIWEDSKWYSIPVEGVPQYHKFDGTKAFKEAVASGRVTMSDFIDITVPEEHYEQVVNALGNRHNISVMLKREGMFVPDEAPSQDFSMEGALVSWLKKKGREDLTEKALTRLKGNLT